MKKESKNFKDKEILGIELDSNGKKIIHIKMGVRRLYKYHDHISYEDCQQLNKELINYERWTEFYKKYMGVDDYQDENN